MMVQVWNALVTLGVWVISWISCFFDPMLLAFWGGFDEKSMFFTSFLYRFSQEASYFKI